MYMRRINSGVVNSREVEEPVLRRGKASPSPTMEAGGLGRTLPHAPVTSQSWGRSYAQLPQVGHPVLSTFDVTATLQTVKILLRIFVSFQSKTSNLLLKKNPLYT